MGRDGCRGVSMKWILCSEKRSRSVRFVSPMYCLLHFLHSIIYVKLVELQVIWCLACVAGGIVGFRSHKQKRRSRDSERRSREWLGEEKLKYRLPGWAAFLASAPLFAF